MSLTLNFAGEGGQMHAMVFTEGLHALAPLTAPEGAWVRSLLVSCQGSLGEVPLRPEHFRVVPRDPTFPEALFGRELAGAATNLARYGVSYLADKTVFDMLPEERRTAAYVHALEGDRELLVFEEPDQTLEGLWRYRKNPHAIAVVLSQRDLTWAFDSRRALSRRPRFIEVQCTDVQALAETLSQGFSAHWMRAGASIWIALRGEDGATLTALHEVLARTHVRVVALRLVGGDST